MGGGRGFLQRMGRSRAGVVVRGGHGVRVRPPQKTARIMARFLGSAGPVAGVLPVHTGDER